MFQVGANSGDNITVGGLVNSTAKGLADVVYAYDHSTGIVASSVTDLTEVTSTSAFQITVTGGATVDLGAIKAATSGAERLGQLVEAINRKTVATGVVAFLSQDSSGNFTLDLQSSKLNSSGDAQTVTLSGFNANNFGYAAAAVGAAGVSLTATDTPPTPWGWTPFGRHPGQCLGWR